MRQSIGGSWLIGLMVLFILLFAGYIILTVDYNKSIRVKNEAISIVEKYEGLNEESITLLNNYLIGAGYLTTGKCGSQDGLYGAVSLNDTELEEAVDGQRYYYCVKKYKGANTSYYYQLSLFYRFNLPILGDASRFTVKGSTANFQPKDDIKYSKTIDGSNGGTVNSGGNNTEATYTVRFNVNGGSTSIPNQQVQAGYRASKPSDPVRTGYTFKGWKLGGSYYDFSSPVSSNITLVADWVSDSGGGSATQYIVKFDVNGGSTSIPDQQVSAGNKVSRPSNPVRSGYTFNGWKLSGSTYNFNTPVNNDITLIADWVESIPEYEIISDFNGGVWGGRWQKLIDYCPAGSTKRFDGYWESTTKAGYTLDYFIDNKGKKYYKSNASLVCTEDLTLTAVWK